MPKQKPILMIHVDHAWTGDCDYFVTLTRMPTLENLQSLVRGPIERVQLTKDVCLFVDEEARLKNTKPFVRLPRNDNPAFAIANGLVIHGPFVFTYGTGGCKKSLTEEQIAHWTAYFKSPAAEPH